jgi:hypothetical protein
MAWAIFLCGSPIAFGAEQQCLQQGNVRVFYHTDGQHAVESTDADGNGIADQVQDAMTQITAARLLFVKLLDFPDPFASDRFRDAAFLDVHFRHKDLLKSNGIAYDELQRFKRPTDPPETRSLCFNLATSIHPSKNLSPAHEYFHLIQYGVTYFKNSWYTEGTARWSECGLGTGSVGAFESSQVWPVADEGREMLFSRRYDAAETFWNALAQQHDDAEGELPASAALVELQNMKYVDGSPVLRDSRFSGHRFIRAVLLELGKTHDTAFRELAYDRWSEANQYSPRNSPYILEAVGRVIDGWQAK